MNNTTSQPEDKLENTLIKDYSQNDTTTPQASHTPAQDQITLLLTQNNMKNQYKTTCDKCYQPTWYETEQPCKRTISKGCPTCGSHENISKESRCTGTLRVIDYSGLDSRLWQFYEANQRVEITFEWGKERGYIGKSIGWKPCWLLIKKSNSSGGEAIHEFLDVTGLNKYK
jgi:hypothetical protein